MAKDEKTEALQYAIAKKIIENACNEGITLSVRSDGGGKKETDKPTHTPTPWTAIDSGCSNFVHVETASDCKPEAGLQIATVNKGNKSQRMVNARFIVRACNSHDDLVEALIRLLACPDLNLENMEQATINDIQTARKALAKAKGGENE